MKHIDEKASKKQKLTKREEEIRDYIVDEYEEEKRSDE